MMKHPWTPERRERQRALMMERKPWLKSTGPKTAAGKAKAARNSRKHGLRSAPARDIAKQRAEANLPARRARRAGVIITKAEALAELLRRGYFDKKNRCAE